ncbi:MAG: putative Zn-dependent protease [Thermoproteota archaeon]|jgi:predicted Zn-dependent protease
MSKNYNQLSDPKVIHEKVQLILNDIFKSINVDEFLTVSFNGEETDFYRFNNSKVRQNTHLSQYTFELSHYKANKKISSALTVNLFNLEDSIKSFNTILEKNRNLFSHIQDDPFVDKFEASETSFEHQGETVLYTDQIIETIEELTKEVDFCGVYVGGEVFKGLYNSNGMAHWFSSNSFYIDYSLYNSKQKAVKDSVAGTYWDKDLFSKNLSYSISLLEKLDLPEKVLEKGNYRTYLAPSAVGEMAHLFNWNGFSYSALKQGSSAFAKAESKEKSFSKKFSLSEDFSNSLVPRFNGKGEMAELHLPIIKNGEVKNFLTSKKSAIEYSTIENEVISNKASSSEAIRSMKMGTGSLKEEDILKELGTGLYLSNLHYLNWSDLQNARITGMTRFACFWVEDGVIQGPIKDMRFDDDFYSVLGSSLEQVTDFTRSLPENSTYETRSIGELQIPGILLKEFKLTL